MVRLSNLLLLLLMNNFMSAQIYNLNFYFLNIVKNFKKMHKISDFFLDIPSVKGYYYILHYPYIFLIPFAKVIYISFITLLGNLFMCTYLCVVLYLRTLSVLS